MTRRKRRRYRHWFAVMLVGAVCLAAWAPAAQARPVGLEPTGSGWTAQSPRSSSGPQVRVVTTSADGGFSWADTAIGAGGAVLALALGRIAFTRPRPRPRLSA